MREQHRDVAAGKGNALTLRKIMKALTPPVLVRLFVKVTSRPDSPDVLFDGHDELFKRVIRGARHYGEYGCGRSTRWVLNHTTADVIAIENSPQWIEQVLSDNAAHQDRLLLHHVDLGAVRDWGHPIDYSERHRFAEYTDFLWKQPSKPNVVLIDGRFRVCCFLTALKYADEGTHILFDDYTTRPRYHVVEEYLEPTEVCGRQCLFIVPARDKLDLASLNKDIDGFRHVID